MPSFFNVDMNTEDMVPFPETCIRDFTTSAGKMRVHRAVPPMAPDTAVLASPISSFVFPSGVNKYRDSS